MKGLDGLDIPGKNIVGWILVVCGMVTLVAFVASFVVDSASATFILSDTFIRIIACVIDACALYLIVGILRLGKWREYIQVILAFVLIGVSVTLWAFV